MTASKTGRELRKRKRKWNGVRFIAIDHPVLDSAAFKALSGAAAKALLLLLRRWNGPVDNNNGRLPLSVRDTKDFCHVRTDRALGVRQELAASGLAVPVQLGSFSWKERHATTWRIAFLPTSTEPPEFAFARAGALPENSKVGTRSGNRSVPAGGTDSRKAEQKIGQSVPTVGTEQAFLGTHSGNTSKLPPTTPAKRPWHAPTCNEIPISAQRAHGCKTASAPNAPAPKTAVPPKTRVPQGSRRDKAEWLRAHLEAGVLTPEAVAGALEIQPAHVAEIASGKSEIAITGWRRLAALAAERLH